MLMVPRRVVTSYPTIRYISLGCGPNPPTEISKVTSRRAAPKTPSYATVQCDSQTRNRTESLRDLLDEVGASIARLGEHDLSPDQHLFWAQARHRRAR